MRVIPTLALIAHILIGGTLAAAATDDDAPRPDAPALGFGLNGVSDWSPQLPFIDVMKSGREWTGHEPGEWGGWRHDDLAEGGFLDADGWPVAIPDELQGIGTVLLNALPADAESAEGNYRLTYSGSGRIELGGRIRLLSHAPGEIRFHFAPGDGIVDLRILETDPEGTGDHIRDISVVHEADIEAFDGGALFNPRWLSRLEGAAVLRFMDWMKTNNSTQARWADRPRRTDYTWTREGIPLEVMIELANRLQVDPWFTLPHLADDDYMRRFAEMVRDRLDPARRAYVEYSNEVWNWQFAQARWADEQAQARWGRENRWVQYYGMRAAQMAQIWDEVFGAQAEERLVKVISTQTGWIGLEEDILQAPLWAAEDPQNISPPFAHFDAYGVTGYFHAKLGYDEKAPMVHDWIAASQAAAEAEAEARGLDGRARAAHVAAHRYDLAVDIAAIELRDGSISGNRDSSLHDRLEMLEHHAEVARDHGLSLVMYEGGTHVVGRGKRVDDETLTAFFIHLNYSAQMGALYSELLEGWHDLGGEFFNAFVDVATPTKWGSWGHLRHLDDDNPRWQALQRGTR